MILSLIFSLLFVRTSMLTWGGFVPKTDKLLFSSALQLRHWKNLNTHKYKYKHLHWESKKTWTHTYIQIQTVQLGKWENPFFIKHKHNSNHHNPRCFNFLMLSLSLLKCLSIYFGWRRGISSPRLLVSNSLTTLIWLSTGTT